MDYIILLSLSPAFMAFGIWLQWLPGFPEDLSSLVLWAGSLLYLLILPAAVKKVRGHTDVIFAAKVNGLNLRQTFCCVFHPVPLVIHFVLNAALIGFQWFRHKAGAECLAVLSPLLWHGICCAVIARKRSDSLSKLYIHDGYWSRVDMLYPLLFRFAVLVIAFSLTYNTYSFFRQLMETIPVGSAWTSIENDYGVVPMLNVGDDGEELDAQINQLDIAINGELYPWLNQRGAVYCYWKASEHGIDSLWVNPNYMKLYPILDTNGDPVVIDETETAEILLIPSDYPRQDEVIDFFRKRRQGSLELEEIYHVEHLTSDNSIRVIAVQPNQRLFTLLPNRPYVTNAVIRVVTEKNCLITERECFLGGGILDPLKICLKEDFRADLLPLLQRLELADNIRSIWSIKTYREAVLAQCRDVLLALVLLTLLSVAISFSLDLAALYSYAKKRFCEVNLKYCLGWPFHKRYAWFSALQLMYLLMTILLAVYGGMSVDFTAAVIALEALEMLLAILCIARKERRKRALYLKGE